MNNNVFPLICAVQTRVCLLGLCLSLFAITSWLYQERKIHNLEEEIRYLNLEKTILEEEINNLHK